MPDRFVPPDIALGTGAVTGSPATLVVRDRETYNATKATLLGRLLGNRLVRTRVLNLGGGGGFLGVWCAERGATVTMVSDDSDALEATRVLARYRGVEERMRLICSEDLPPEVARYRFDVVIAKNVLEDAPDDGALLQRLAGCQAPGGRLLLSTQNRWSLNYALEGTYHRRWCHERDWCGWHPAHRRFYTPPVLARRLERAGYRVERWAGVFILPYNILSWMTLLRRNVVLSGIHWLDLALGERFPFNRLGWNLLVSAERLGAATPVPVAAAPPDTARPAFRIGVRRQPPVHSPVGLRDVTGSATSVLARRDPRAQLVADLRRELDARDVVLTSSGTHALQVALVAASRAADGTRRVALPAYTCYDVAAAAVGVGAEIDLYDLDPVTLAPDVDSVAATLAAGTRIVVVSPLWGVPVPWEDLEWCAAAFGAVLVEDAAQGHGSAWKQRPLGALGRISVLSFGRGKGWTGGSGGAVLVRGPETEISLDWLGVPGGLGLTGELSVVARAAAQLAFGRPWTYSVPAMVPWLHLGETRYREPPPVAAMTRAAAALLQAGRASAALEGLTRRLNAEFLLERLPDTPHMRRIRPPDGGVPGYLRLPLLLSRGLAGFSHPPEARRLGMAPGYPTTLAVLDPVRRQMTASEGHWPGADVLARQLVTLPTHSLVTSRDRATILRLLAAYTG